jgi:hypothetical protein
MVKKQTKSTSARLSSLANTHLALDERLSPIVEMTRLSSLENAQTEFNKRPTPIEETESIINVDVQNRYSLLTDEDDSKVQRVPNTSEQKPNAIKQ